MNIQEKPLTIDLKPIFDRSFAAFLLSFSERNFANLYLYQEQHNWQALFKEQMLIGVTGLTHDGVKVFMPIDERVVIQKEALALLQFLTHTFGVQAIYPLQEVTARSLSLYGFSLSYKLDDGDYMMSRVLLANYPGRFFDGRRNFVHQFEKSGTVRIGKLSASTIQDAHTILSAWNELHDDASEEKRASLRGVDEYEVLGIEGWIAYLNDAPEAICYGQALTKNCYLLHCAKSRRRDIKGALPYLHQKLAQEIGEQHLFINWEQDLGLMGLRKSKLAYAPDHMMSKWRVDISGI